MRTKLKKVISASRRTDIPAFYLDWFISKIKDGNVEVENPFYPGNFSKVDLSPENIGWIVFWSRDYSKFLKNGEIFKRYQLYFHFTVNLKNPLLEKGIVSEEDAVLQMKELVKIFGSERVMWRFDPIFFHDKGSNYNANLFEKLCKKLSNIGIRQCTFSFAHPYSKIQKRINRLGIDLKMIDPPIEEKLSIAKKIKDITSNHNIKLSACCNKDILNVKGINQSHCIDGRTLNELSEIKVSVAKHVSRDGCGCTKSIDIGSYKNQPCLNNCLYCYANPKL